MVVGLTTGAPLLLKALLVLVQNVFRVVHGHEGSAESVMPDALVRVVCKSKKISYVIKLSVSIRFNQFDTDAFIDTLYNKNFDTDTIPIRYLGVKVSEFRYQYDSIEGLCSAACWAANSFSLSLEMFTAPPTIGGGGVGLASSGMGVGAYCSR